MAPKGPLSRFLTTATTSSSEGTKRSGAQLFSSLSRDSDRGRQPAATLAAGANAGAGAPHDSRAWPEKFAPSKVSELAVHKKKIEEVREWLEYQLHVRSRRDRGGRFLILTGPPGAGKTTTVRVLAREMGVRVTEWTAPVPTLYAEVQSLRNGGLVDTEYTSKMRSFEEFLQDAILFKSLSLLRVSQVKHVAPPDTSSVEASHVPASGGRLVLIDDLPFAAGADGKKALENLLCEAARSSSVPMILILTDSLSRGGDTRRPNGGSSHLQFYHLQQRLHGVGARTIPFNPIAITKMREAMTRIMDQARSQVSAKALSELAEAANGDVRHAASMLQWYILPGNRRIAKDGVTKRKEKDRKERGKGKRKRDDDGDVDVALVGSEACDPVLTIHHAVGKFLYNKRGEKSELDNDTLKDWLSMRKDLVRNTSQVDVERVLAESQEDGDVLSAFLHENYPDFVHEASLVDAADIVDCLSDSDQIRGQMPKTSGESSLVADAQGTLQEVISTSIGVRGLMFAMQHPAARSFRPIRAPQLGSLARDRMHNFLSLQLDAFHMFKTPLGTECLLERLPFHKAQCLVPDRSHSPKQVSHGQAPESRKPPLPPAARESNQEPPRPGLRVPEPLCKQGPDSAVPSSSFDLDDGVSCSDDEIEDEDD